MDEHKLGYTFNTVCLLILNFFLYLVHMQEPANHVHSQQLLSNVIFVVVKESVYN